MTRDRMLALLKEIIDGLVLPYAWKDTTLLAYLAEGQDKFCEDTGFFIDRSNFTITLQDGVAVYAIPDRVIQIYEIFSGTRKLGKFTEGDRPTGQNEWDPSIDPEVTGAPTSWQTDRETGYITFDNTPTSIEDGTVLVIRAWRYSLYPLDDDDIDGDGTTATPELPTRFQWATIEWAAYRAYRHHDQEQQDPVGAREHLAEYNRYVSEGKLFMRNNHGIEPRVTTNPTYVGV